MCIASEICRDPEEGAKRLEREYKARLMSVAMNLCGDRSEAEALVYDAMGKAVAGIDSLSDSDKLFGWMCSILVNTHGKATRRMSNDKVMYTDNLPEQPEEPDGAESVSKSVDGALLRDAIAELPEKLRESVILRYFMDMPLIQVARFLKIPVGTVNSRLHLARKALAARLNPTAKKACVAALAVLALLGATAALWVGGVFDGGEWGAKTTGTTKTTVTSETVPEVPVVPEVPETSESQSTEETRKENPMNMKAKAMVATALVLPAAYGGVEATGGTQKYIFEGYMVHTFTESGTFTVTRGGKVDVLVVGGGGGGGVSTGGGGGGGGGEVVYSEGFDLVPGEWTITVGAGGEGSTSSGPWSRTYGTFGGNSSISNLVANSGILALGGARGGTWEENAPKGGGSGGGGPVYGNNRTLNGGVGTVGHGNKGGSGKSTASSGYKGTAGGGGGAASAGANGVSSTQLGIGGSGVTNSISGVATVYGSGGGGGTSLITGKYVVGCGVGAGRGSGINGSSTPYAGESGTANCGGGGGGGGGGLGSRANGAGGAGGSGIVIIRYAIDTDDHFEEITGGKKTRDGDYEIHTFTNSGTLHVSGSSKVDVLVVGGGGGGGAALSGGGGGGAGGVIYKQNLVLVSGDYEIVVGAGGTGGVVDEAGTAITTYSQAGSESSAFGLTAKGGGRGGNTNEAGGGGASGGGAAAYTSTSVFRRFGGGSCVEGQGNCGGASTNDCNQGLIGVAGGGGGAGENGHNGVITSREYAGMGNYGGAGGDGIACSITGEEKWYGGGGGGGFSTYVNSNERGKVPGGKGGGGRGSGRYTTNPPVIHSGMDGENGTGGGGGGGGGYSPNMANGGRGGDGIVIVRCKRVPKGFILFVQ